jgi:hypothetical protein
MLLPSFYYFRMSGKLVKTFQLRAPLFWQVTPRRSAVILRHFGTTYLSTEDRKDNVPKRRYVTSNIRRVITQEPRSNLRCGGSLKSRSSRKLTNLPQTPTTVNFREAHTRMTEWIINGFNEYLQKSFTRYSSIFCAISQHTSYTLFPVLHNEKSLITLPSLIKQNT